MQDYKVGDKVVIRGMGAIPHFLKIDSLGVVIESADEDGYYTIKAPSMTTGTPIRQLLPPDCFIHAPSPADVNEIAKEIVKQYPVDAIPYGDSQNEDDPNDLQQAPKSTF